MPPNSPPLPHPLAQSKGGILSKACDYIQELRQSNHRLSEELQGLDQLQMDNEVLRQQVRQPGGGLVRCRGGGVGESMLAFTPCVSPAPGQVEDLKNKNLILRAQLRQHGVEIVIKNDSH